MSVPPAAAAEQILADLDALRADDPATDTGRVMAYVYRAGVDGLEDVAAAAHRMLQEANALDPTTFPSAARLERDLVAWVGGLLGGGDEVAGTATGGGTESILLAVKAAREAWRHAGGTGRGVVVLAQTAHPAFHKAAHLLDLDVEVVAVPPTALALTGDAAADALERVGGRACLVVASAPSYPHGVVDDVTGVAAAAAARGVRCHVDACVGGMVLPYLARLGVAVPPFDLAVPGVTSLSVDLHKYGYTPKGAALLLHRDRDLRTPQYWAFTDWPGYAMVNAGVTSSKPVGPLAAAWAVTRLLGDEGLEAAAGRILEAVTTIREGLADLAGLRLLGDPVGPLLALGADDRAAAPADPFLVADALARRGWVAQPQPAHRGLPRSLHLTVMPVTAPHAGAFLTALGEAVAEVAGTPPPTPAAELVQAARQLDPAALDGPTARQLLGLAGLGGEGLPAAMAPVHALIEALPPALAARLLAEFWGQVFAPGPATDPTPPSSASGRPPSSSSGGRSSAGSKPST